MKKTNVTKPAAKPAKSLVAKPSSSTAAKPAAKTTTTKPATKTTASKPVVKKSQPKAAQFGFAPAMLGSKSKGAGKTTFGSAMQAMNNLMTDIEMVDTKDGDEFLSDSDKKLKLLNCIQNNDNDTFDMILSMFKTPEESKHDVNDLARQVRTTLNESLLHLAVVHYVEKQDDRYIKSLCNIKFPMYEEDQNGDIPVFALSL